MNLSETAANIVFITALASARNSTCKKARFGAVLYNQKSGLCLVGVNNPLPPLAHVCEPECMRLKIKSRTESMLGACGHAEESVIWHAMADAPREDIPEAEVFVLGVDGEGEPLVKAKADFTCIRCATQMYLAGIPAVNVWLGGHTGFVSIPILEAIKQAHEYATQARDIDASYAA